MTKQMLPVITTNFFSGTSLTKKLYWNLNYFFVQQFIAKKNRIRLKGGRGLVFWYHNDFFQTLYQVNVIWKMIMYLENFLGYISNKLKELVSDVYKDIQYYIVKAHQLFLQIFTKFRNQCYQPQKSFYYSQYICQNLSQNCCFFSFETKYQQEHQLRQIKICKQHVLSTIYVFPLQ